MTAGGTVANSGTITGGGGAAGVDLEGGGSGGNGGWGIFLAAGGLITSGGMISGGSGGAGALGIVKSGTTGNGGGGVYISGGTLVTSGTITGGAGAQDGDAVMFGSLAGALVVDPGAGFIGSVDGGYTVGATSVSTLELASGASVGTLSGLGTQFVDFAQVTVDTGAQWTLLATDTIESGATLTNAGGISGGVTLAAGGELSNTSAGTVAAPSGSAVYGLSGGAATVVNAGLIANADGLAGQGISLAGGGSVTNQGGGSISGYDGICANGPITVLNAGSISGDVDGIKLLAGGSVTNQSGGTIFALDGIEGYNVAVTVANAGDIDGNAGTGVRLLAGGNVTNQDGGTITGAFYAIDSADVPLTVINAGIIAPPFFNVAGVRLFAGGYVTNQSGGTTTGGTGILASGGAMTVVNAGDITGSDGAPTVNEAVQFAAGYANRLVVDPAAVFNDIVTGGNVIGASAVSTLELAGTSAGTLSGIGTRFVDFAQTTIDAGASWTLTGANAFAAGTTLSNAGTLTVQDSALSDAGLVVNDGAIQIDPSDVTLAQLTGTGTVALTGGSTLDVAGSVAAGETNRLQVRRQYAGHQPGRVRGPDRRLHPRRHDRADRRHRCVFAWDRQWQYSANRAQSPSSGRSDARPQRRLCR